MNKANATKYSKSHPSKTESAPIKMDLNQSN